MERVKGTVTPLSSMFPAEEARRASERLHETIGERSKELDNLHHFIADNTNLIKLVQRLPDELHHQIMVPFGKAAFFPGRLVHTNEFLVLLGEGYYAKRTAKHTVEILKRREKALESHVDSLKAVIDDLKAEASFFDRTTSEAVEGLVEIREEYTDEDSLENLSTSGQQKSDALGSPEVNSGKGAVEDVDYERIMSRFDELEREELEAEDTEEEDDAEHDKDNLLGDLSLHPTRRDESSHGEVLMHTHLSKPAEKEYKPSILKTSVRSGPESKLKVPAETPKFDAISSMSRPLTDSLKAFTGSIIERTENLPVNPEKQSVSQHSNSQPSKPVSRFKMQRR